MDDLRVGVIYRAVRRRLRMRQRDVADSAGVHQSVISRIERGHLGEVRVATLRRVGTALEIHMPFEPRWRGGMLPRILDRDHASLIEEVASLFVSRGWQVLPEYTFNEYGERGPVDLVAWQPERPALALVEVKTVLVSVQDLLAQLDRRMRIVPRRLREERGWISDVRAYLVVLPETTAARSAVAKHSSTIRAALPAQSREARAWISRPEGDLRAVWFLSPMRAAHAKQTGGGPRRVRRGPSGHR